MKNLVVFSMLFFVFNETSAQLYAEFTTDTTRIHSNVQRERMAKEVWYINGQKMTYDGKVVKVRVDPTKFDTILYYKQNQDEFDTVLCNVAAPHKYIIKFNECCSFFNIRSESIRIKHSILFRLKNRDKENMYLGSIYASGGATGILVDENTTQAAYSVCHSAMASHRMSFGLSQIKVCEESDTGNLDCENWICLLKEDGEINYDFYAISERVITGFVWLCLNEEPLKVIYDPITDTIEYK